MTDLVFLLNPEAGSVDDEVVAALDERCDAIGGRLVRTESARDATEKARQAARDGAEVVFAGGGDGTVSAVVQGLTEAGGETLLGVVPLGTGNDLARALKIPRGVEAFGAVGDGKVVTVDMIEVRCEDEVRYGLNCLNCGIAPRLAAEIGQAEKRRLGVAAYVARLPEALGSVERRPVRMTVDEEPEVELMLSGVAVANTPTVGGGRTIAPAADPTDGWLDLTRVDAAGTASLAKLMLASGSNRLLEAEHVRHQPIKRLRLELPDTFGANLDGEPLPVDALEVSVRPGAQSLLVVGA